MGPTSQFGSFSGYDEYIPMVDKAVDSVWKKQTNTEKSFVSEGYYCCDGFRSSKSPFF